jgi:sterol 14-demethylase
MSPKTSLVVLVALLAVATALAATAHSANQNGEDFFAKVKSVFVQDGKINTMNAGVVAVIVLALTALVLRKERADLPPLVPYKIPLVGHTVQFGTAPVDLLLEGYKKCGELFRCRIAGGDFYFMAGAEAQKMFYEAPEETLCARKAYSFTVPVFGKDVVYDTDHTTFGHQRKFVSSGLTMKRFSVYVEQIRKETEAYLDEHWGESGEHDLLDELNTLTVLTSTRTLQGEEVRSRFTREFAQLYNDLDRALGAISFYYPNLPIPLHSRRDKARILIGNLYQDIINKRRQTGEYTEDMIHTLMNSEYPDSGQVPDDHIAGMCVALLLAGQHTSNVTSTWTGCHMLMYPHIMEKVMEEQNRIFPFDKPFEIDYEKYKQLTYMNNVIKETLRVRPPIIMVVRKAEHDIPYKQYTIPKGSLVGVSPALSMRLPEFYTNPDEFDPDRFSTERAEDRKKPYSYIAFSAGRHACIGEKFAYLQIATIWSVLLRRYNFDLVNKDVKPDYTTLIVAPIGPITVKYSPRKK